MAVGDDRYVLAVDLNTGNDGAVTAVDGSLFHTSIYIGKKKRILVGINKNG